VINLFSRRVIGWAAADHLHTSLVAAALKMAVSSAGTPSGAGPGIGGRKDADHCPIALTGADTRRGVQCL
jgi:transposase InsO family protein